MPDAHLEDFKSVKKFKIFNTNNLWVNLKAIKRVVEARELSMEIMSVLRCSFAWFRLADPCLSACLAPLPPLSAPPPPSPPPFLPRSLLLAARSVNNKVTDDGRAVIQLETAVGAAIKHFKAAKGINVPRSRFLPVKSCSDLLLIKSDLYDLNEGALVMNSSRLFATTPVVKLGDTFKKVAAFSKRFKTIPSILEADHITVRRGPRRLVPLGPDSLPLLQINGDVVFGKNVTLRGTVIIVANEGNRIQIPDGSILENSACCVRLGRESPLTLLLLAPSILRSPSPFSSSSFPLRARLGQFGNHRPLAPRLLFSLAPDPMVHLLSCDRAVAVSRPSLGPARVPDGPSNSLADSSSLCNAFLSPLTRLASRRWTAKATTEENRAYRRACTRPELQMPFLSIPLKLPRAGNRGGGTYFRPPPALNPS